MTIRPLIPLVLVLLLILLQYSIWTGRGSVGQVAELEKNLVTLRAQNQQTEADIARIDPQLGAFQGRVARDNIVDQAGYLARGDKAGFEARYGALGGEL